ncbi:hypothetical protein GOBAR_DD11432 [Gossypium barbadense]|nr:hypothetical protein GOBAR_DD11432 [Gossypium barbadense]
MDSDTSPNDQEVNPWPTIVFAFHRKDCTATLAWKYVILILKTHRLQVFVDGTILIPSQMVTDESGTPVYVLCDEQQSTILYGLPLEYENIVSIVTTSQRSDDLPRVVSTLLNRLLAFCHFAGQLTLGLFAGQLALYHLWRLLAFCHFAGQLALDPLVETSSRSPLRHERELLHGRQKSVSKIPVISIQIPPVTSLKESSKHFSPEMPPTNIPLSSVLYCEQSCRQVHVREVANPSTHVSLDVCNVQPMVTRSKVGTFKPEVRVYA